MRIKILISAVPVLIYLVFMSGVICIEADCIRIIVKRRRLRHRLAKNTEGRLSSMCTALLSGAFGKNIDGVWLIVFELILFFSSFVVAFRSFTLPMALVLSLIIDAFPILLINSRLKSVQQKGNSEAVSLVTELYRQYRISGLNIYEALAKTVESKGEFPVCRTQLYLLLIRLTDAAGRQEIKESCRRFSFALGSVWAGMLAGCIEISAARGTDISAALEDIIDRLKESKAQLEERKRLNSEAMRMTLFLVPFLYAATVLAALKYLGISPERFFRNQFMTPQGLLFFLVTVIMFFVNILLLGLVGSVGADI